MFSICSCLDHAYIVVVGRRTCAMPVSDISTPREFDAAVARHRFLMVNFTMAGCQPCAMVKPTIDLLSDSPKYLAVGFVRVDINANAPVAARYAIAAAPLFVFLKLGQEVKRVTGGNLQAIVAELDRLQAQAALSGASAKIEFKTDALKQGYDLLNPLIDFQGFEALNVQGLAKLVFKANTPAKGVWLDADSQLMFYVPLMNVSKVHLILIKARSGVVVDETDGETAQRPSTVKVWPNLPLPLLFDDAESDSNPAHGQLIEFSDGSDWVEVKLKFVRFQKVQLLCVFLDGDDEDTPTLVDQIVVVGVLGDLTEVAKLPRDGQ